MSKLLKKSLACCLAIALCLTMAVGAITASADTNTIVVGEVSVANDQETVALPIIITTTGINVATLTIKLPASEDATINAITDIAAEGAVATWKTGDNTVSDSTAEEFVAPVVSGNKITLMVNAIDSTGVFTEAVITITYSLADVAVGTYAVEVTASEAYDNNKDDANLVALTATAGSITVTQAAHDCVAGEPVVESEVAPTCKVEGSRVEVIYCSICNAEMSRSTIVVPVVDHTPGEVVIENSVAPSCSAAGSYENVTYCTVCEEECSRETIEVDPTEHTASDPVVENTVDATCEADGSFDTVIYCGVCGHEISRVTSTVAALGHEYDAVVTAPTCEAAGYTTYTCKNDASHTYVGDEVAALGHEYTYNNDGDTHSATCANGCAGITGEAHNYVDGECVCGAVEEHVCDFGEGTVIAPATEKVSGIIEYRCSCGKMRQDSISATGAADGVVFNISYGSVVANEVSLKNYAYTYTYKVNSGTFLDAVKAAKGKNRKLHTVLTMANGKETIFTYNPTNANDPESMSTQGGHTLTGFNLDKFNSVISFKIRLTWDDENTPGDDYLDSTAIAINIAGELEEAYHAGNYADKQAELVAAFIAFNNEYKATSTFENYTATFVDADGSDGVNYNIAYGSVVPNVVSLKNFSYAYTYKVNNPGTFIDEVKAGKGNGRRLHTVISVGDGKETVFTYNPTNASDPESMATQGGHTLTGMSLLRMKKEMTIHIRLTYTDSVTGQPVVVNAGTMKVVPYDAVVAAAGESVLAAKYVAYETIWAECYNK